MEIVTRDETSGSFLVQCGLLFPFVHVPRQYERAMEVAVAGRCGLWRLGHPWQHKGPCPGLLRRPFCQGSLLWPYPAPVAS